MPSRHINFLLIAGAVCLLCYAAHRRTRSVLLVGDALNLIDAYYVEPVERDDLVTAAMDGLTKGLDDHTEFIPVEAYSAFQDSIQQEFAGIGIYVEQPEKGKPVRVVTPLVGSPALRAGLLPNDEILHVDQTDVSSLPIGDVSELLRGPIGTQVRIGVRRADPNEEVQVTVRRDRIELESVLGDYRDDQDRWVYRLKDDPRIAYMRMSSFGEKTRDELKAVLVRLNNDFDSLVLDLRGNGGGLLYTAVDVADMFLAGGNVVSTRGRDEKVEESLDATRNTLVAPDKPVAILIDGGSASASEIVAAALQDHDRATVVGTRSFGKGTVQNVLPLQYGRSALRLTVARYYRPSGVNIHRSKDFTEDDTWGVTPNPGGLVELDESDLKKIADRWKRSTYPSLAKLSIQDKADSEPEVDIPVDEDSVDRETVDEEAVDQGAKVSPGPSAKEADTDTSPLSKETINPEDDSGANGRNLSEPASASDPKSNSESIASPTPSSPTKSDSSLETDPQLRRAVEILREKMGHPSSLPIAA